MTDNSKEKIRKKRKTYNIEGHAHELTFSCYHQYCYLEDPVSCTIFMEELSAAREQYNFQIWAYVLMPTHVHLLLYPLQKVYNISMIQQSIKGKMSTRYRRILLEKNPDKFERMCVTAKGKKVFRFWQTGGGFDRNLWSSKAILYSINYIEANPVRAKLVKNPEDWQWSSYRARKYKEGLEPDDFEIPFLSS